MSWIDGLSLEVYGCRVYGLGRMFSVEGTCFSSFQVLGSGLLEWDA